MAVLLAGSSSRTQRCSTKSSFCFSALLCNKAFLHRDAFLIKYN